MDQNDHVVGHSVKNEVNENLKSKLMAGIRSDLSSVNYSYSDIVVNILAGKTGLSSSGFPYISEHSFQQFLHHVPHLFRHGQELLTWLNCVSRLVDHMRMFSNTEHLTFNQACKVLQNIVCSAAITAPSDLWLMRYILSSYQKLGINDDLLAGKKTSLNQLAKNHHLDPVQLKADVDFLYSRGGLNQAADGQISVGESPQARDALGLGSLNSFGSVADIHGLLVQLASQVSVSSKEIENLTGLYQQEIPDAIAQRTSWFPSGQEIDLSWKVLPVILMIRSMGWAEKLQVNDDLHKFLNYSLHFTLPVLECASVTDSAHRLTHYGHRMITRGPGPFGIIYAYHGYLAQHKETLLGASGRKWVARKANVSASQDANRKTFQMANDALNQFCDRYSYSYSVFIEHAVGQGEACRQRLAMSGDTHLQYIGADLEDAAIDAAIECQKNGDLPANMKFVRNADIGCPEKLISELNRVGISPYGAVMMVGNGFHEIRQQTNEKMIDVFKQYSDAGLILLFTEESGLSDQDLLETAWNTYHAGFRYVHEISGQGLRPAWDREGGAVYSWRKCASLGGYYLFDEFSTRTRRIYPHPKSNGYNPSISVNYFCVPRIIAASLLKE